MDFAKTYDKYIEYYNGSNNKITALAEFQSVKKSIEAHIKRKDEFIEWELDSLKREIKIVRPSFEESITEAKARLTRTIPRLYDISETILTLFDKYFLYKLRVKKEVIQELCELITDYFNLRNTPENTERSIRDLYLIARLKEEREQVWEQLSAIRIIMGRIIDQGYPKKLEFWRELPDDQKEEIGRVGAPFNDQVPQKEVQEIVNDLIQRPEGRIVLERNGDKNSYLVIHQKGKRRGKGNVNQIFKYFVDFHPGLINIGERAFVKRIKRALPDNMK